MGRNKREDLASMISARLREMAPENCSSIEEAAENAALLAEMGLCAESSVEDFEVAECGHVTWHGVCQVCE